MIKDQREELGDDGGTEKRLRMLLEGQGVILGDGDLQNIKMGISFFFLCHLR